MPASRSELAPLPGLLALGDQFEPSLLHGVMPGLYLMPANVGGLLGLFKAVQCRLGSVALGGQDREFAGETMEPLMQLVVDVEGKGAAEFAASRVEHLKA
jgi:hypothetical protein